MTAVTEAPREVSLDDVEIWEATTESTIWLHTLDTLAGNGAWTQRSVGGPNGNRRIHLTVRERRFNQDRIPSSNAHLDPFINGMLIARQGSQQSPNGYTDEQLITLLKMPSDADAAFEQVVQSITSEVLIRRLFGLAERNAPAYRRDWLEDVVDDRYRIGYTQRSLRTDLPEKGVGNGVLISS